MVGIKFTTGIIIIGFCMVIYYVAFNLYKMFKEGDVFWKK